MVRASRASVRLARSWADTMMSTPSPKGKKPRSAHYVAGLVNGMSALWEKWFVEELQIVPGNPWGDVTPPKTDKLPVKYVTDDQLNEFTAWLDERFGDWELPKLLIAVKEHTGCRLADVCSLKSSQLRGGRIVFPAGITKGRKERAVPLPDDVYGKLTAVKGKTWLWETHPAGLKAVLQAKGWPSHQLNPAFAPSRLYSWVETLFGDYHTAYPDRPKITSHQFRKRAFTRAYQAGIPLDDAAVAYGCNVDTIKGHYLGVDEQDITDGVFARMSTPNKPAQQTGDPGRPNGGSGGDLLGYCWATETFRGMAK